MRGVYLGAIFAVLVATGLGVAASSGKASPAKYGNFNYRVILATSSSSSQKSEPPQYTGSSTVTWKLARATKKAPNVIGIVSTPSVTYGLGEVNIKGVFTAEATTNFGNGAHCTLTAPTGSKQYPAAAPGHFTFAIGNDSKAPRRLLASWAFATFATLGNPYFGTECSTSLTGEPDSNQTRGIVLPKGVIGKNLITIRSHGSSSASGITYKWSTTFKLKKIVKKRRR